MVNILAADNIGTSLLFCFCHLLPSHIKSDYIRRRQYRSESRI